MNATSRRALPALDPSNTAFWRGGAHGQLRLGRCDGCGQVVHPAVTVCPRCHTAVDDSAAVDGGGTVVAVTRNDQRWPQAPEPPYTVAIVALDAAPHVRLTTNLVNLGDRQACVGLPVRVVFEPAGDVWLPLFEPDPDRHAIVRPDSLVSVPAPMITTRREERFERQAVITGVGSSAVQRRHSGPEAVLVSDACRAAVVDAGLRLSDIDGVCAYPGPSGMPGLSDGGARELCRHLDLRPLWHNGGAETPGQTGSVVSALLAIASGLCTHVLCFTSVSQARRPSAPVLAGGRVAGEAQWQLPFGSATPANWIALYASHYMTRYGVQRETLGWIALAERAHARRNPQALQREPMSMDDYLGARPISTPFGLYDCDLPCDGAWALVVSRAETAEGAPHGAVRIDAVGTALQESPTWDQGTLTHQPHVFSAATHLWSRSSFIPRDVDVALLYDGFTFNALCWLEALGFCGVGEAAGFVDGGTRIGPGGELPLNPHGGHLNCGRSNGFGHLIEAVRQLRGQAGERQVAGARVAVCSSGGGIPAGCMVLHR